MRRVLRATRSLRGVAALRARRRRCRAPHARASGGMPRVSRGLREPRRAAGSRDPTAEPAAAGPCASRTARNGVTPRKDLRRADADEVKPSARSGGRTDTKEPSMAATRGQQPTSAPRPRSAESTAAPRPSSTPTGATPAIRRSRCCESRSPSHRSRSASTSSSTSWSTGRSTSPPGSTTSRPAPARTSCTSSAPSRSSPASLVALKPRYGAYVVAGWLAGIVINLLTASGFYDVALRDFGLMLAALTLARLASVYDPPLRLRRR